MKKLYILMALATVSAIAKDPNFSLKNKSGFDIVMRVDKGTAQSLGSPDTTFGQAKPTIVRYKLNDITNDDKPKQLAQRNYALGDSVLLKKNRSFTLELGDGSAYAVSVWYTDENGSQKKVTAEFALNNDATFYVKFQKKGGTYTIVPQEGGVFSKKTTEGYSLKNNIKSIGATPYDGSRNLDKVLNLE